METNLNYSVKHSIRGRLRLSFPALISRKNLMREMKKRFSGARGVQSVRANHSCGSLILHYDPEIVDRQYLLSILKEVPQNAMVQSNVSISQVNTQKGDHRAPLLKGTKDKSIFSPWNLAGTFLIGTGIIGLFLPLVPTFPLFLLAAFCYFRGSPKFYNRLIQFGPIGSMIKNYREGKGLTARTKLRAILFMWISLTISMVFLVSGLTLRIILLLVGLGVTLHILRIKTFVPEIAIPRHRLTAPKRD